MKQALIYLIAGAISAGCLVGLLIATDKLEGFVEERFPAGTNMFRLAMLVLGFSVLVALKVNQ